MSGVGEFFDAEAERYDSAYDQPSAAGRALRARLAAAVNLVGQGPGDALDAGMGAGRLCVELDERGWTVSGVDLSSAMVAVARERLPHRRKWLVEGSVCALPFSDTSFDAVVATGVLEYVVDDLADAARELARVLRPGGLAVLSFPNHLSPVHLWRGRVLYPVVRAVKRVVRFRRPPPPTQPLASPDRLEQALAQSGLTVESVRLVDVRPARASGLGVARRFATQLVFAARRVP